MARSSASNSSQPEVGSLGDAAQALEELLAKARTLSSLKIGEQFARAFNFEGVAKSLKEVAQAANETGQATEQAKTKAKATKAKAAKASPDTAEEMAEEKPRQAKAKPKGSKAVESGTEAGAGALPVPGLPGPAQLLAGFQDIEKFIGPVSEKITAIFQNPSQAISGVVQGYFKDFSKQFGSVGDLGQKIQGIFANPAGAIQGLVGGYFKNFQGKLGDLAEVGQRIKGAFENPSAAIQGLVGGYFKNFQSQFGNLGDIGQKIQGVFANPAGAIQGLVGGYFKNFSSQFGNIGDIGQRIKGVFENPAGAIQNLVGGYFQNFPAQFGQLAGFGQQIAGLFAGAGPGVTEAINRYFGGFSSQLAQLGPVTKQITDLFANAGPEITKAVSGYFESFATQFGKLGETGQKITQLLQSSADGAVKVLQENATKLGAEVTKLAGSISQGVQSLLGGLQTQVAGLGTKMGELGKALPSLDKAGVALGSLKTALMAPIPQTVGIVAYLAVAAAVVATIVAGYNYIEARNQSLQTREENEAQVKTTGASLRARLGEDGVRELNREVETGRVKAIQDYKLLTNEEKKRYKDLADFQLDVERKIYSKRIELLTNEEIEIRKKAATKAAAEVEIQNRTEEVPQKVVEFGSAIDATTVALNQTRTKLEAELSSKQSVLSAPVEFGIEESTARSFEFRSEEAIPAPKSPLPATASIATPIAEKAKEPAGMTPRLQKDLDEMQAKFLDVAGKVERAFTDVIGAAVSSLAQGIEGLINGTLTWGQALQKIGSSIMNSVIGSISRMFAEWIAGRALVAAKEIFFSGKEAGAKLLSALLSSISSFGLASVLGLAAFGTAIAALSGAFASGGMVPGAPSSRDNRIAAVASGEYIVNAAAVQHYGAGYFEALNSFRVPANTLDGIRVPVPHVSGSSAFAAGGLVGPANMGPSQAAAPNISVQPAPITVVHVSNERDLLRVLETTQGQIAIVRAATRNRDQFGIGG